MTRTRRYAVAVGIGLAAGFYAGARTTTIVLQDRIGDTKADKLADLASRIASAQQRVDDIPPPDPSNEWFENHPIVQRLEREEEEAEARASGKSIDSDRALELLRRSKVGDGDTTLDALVRKSKPRGA